MNPETVSVGGIIGMEPKVVRANLAIENVTAKESGARVETVRGNGEGIETVSGRGIGIGKNGPEPERVSM